MEQFEQSELAESVLDIKQYSYMFWAWAWLIVLVGLLAGGGAYVVSKLTTPSYQSSTSLLVSAPSATSGIDPTAWINTQTMTSTYLQMLVDRPMMQAVIDQLKLPTTPKALRKTISANIVTNTQLITITVKNRDPEQAALIANTIASVFTARVRDLQSQRYAMSREGLRAQVSDMEKQIATTSDQIAAIEQQITTSATQTAEAGAKGTPPAPPATGIPDSPALVQLQARMTQYRTIYANLVTSYEQVRLSEEQNSTNVVVTEPAVASTIPVSPMTTLNTLLAVVVGMLLAAAAVVTADRFDDTIKNPDEFRRKFNLPILAMIASHESRDQRPVALAEPRSSTAEAFRSLRTNITYAAIDRPLRRIMVTSPTPQDGKTTVACSLAVVLAQNEKRLVLLDADLRRPHVHHKFGLQNRVGLCELFVRPLDDLTSIINAINLPNLAVITSGALPPNPAELLMSHMMGKILDRLNQDFDLIVIDAPPLLTVTDAAVLAPAMDGVILVAKPGTTKLGAFKQALEQLQAVGARVLGVVLNEVNPSNRKYGYYYNRYSKYQGNYEGGWGGSKKRDTVVAAELEVAVAVPRPEALRAAEQSQDHDPAVSAEPEPAVAVPSPGTLSRGKRRRKHRTVVSAELQEPAPLPGAEIKN